jgi:hypothetical protein
MPERVSRFLESEGVPHFAERKDAMLALFPKNSVGAELGVLRANNSANIIEAVQPSRLFLVDPWSNNDARYANVVSRFSKNANVTILRKTSGDAVPKLPELDWYEEDTSKAFEVTYDNMLKYNNLLRVGGIAMIDYCNREVGKHLAARMVAVEKFLFRHTYLCIGFVDKTSSIILQKTGIPFIADTREDMYRLFPRNSVGLEIGVCRGENAKSLIGAISPSSLTLVDPWIADTHSFFLEPAFINGSGAGLVRDSARAKGLAAEDAYQCVKRIAAKSKNVDVVRGFSYDVVPGLPDKSLDWVYIDGLHTFEAVTKDLALVLPKMKDECIIAGHDWTYISYHGVINAVRNFVAEHNDFRYVGVTREILKKSFMLKRGK